MARYACRFDTHSLHCISKLLFCNAKFPAPKSNLPRLVHVNFSCVLRTSLAQVVCQKCLLGRMGPFRISTHPKRTMDLKIHKLRSTRPTTAFPRPYSISNIPLLLTIGQLVACVAVHDGSAPFGFRRDSRWGRLREHHGNSHHGCQNENSNGQYGHGDRQS